MKIKILFIYIMAFSWATLYANPLVDAYGPMNQVVLKFVLMGVVVPPVAIYMLYQDKNTPNPSKYDILVTIILSVILIWLGYEISVDTFMPVWGGLIMSFVLGLFSLSIVLKIKEKLTGTDGIIDVIANNIKKWISKKLGNNGK